VPKVRALDLSLPPAAEGSAEIGLRAAAARRIQSQRYRALGVGSDVITNAQADGELLEQVASPDDAGRQLLLQAADAMKLSARGYHRVLKVARTLADLEAVDNVNRIHIAEALSYRRIRPTA